MICKDCLPVFYTNDELRVISHLDRPEFLTALDNQHRLVLKHVELCPRHAAPDMVLAEWEAQTRIERRHALLQASATIEPFAATAEEAVRRAANLLAEIESSETQETKR